MGLARQPAGQFYRLSGNSNKKGDCDIFVFARLPSLIHYMPLFSRIQASSEKNGPISGEEEEESGTLSCTLANFLLYLFRF